MVSLDLHICDLQEKAESDLEWKGKICIYKHIACQHLNEDKTGRNADDINTTSKLQSTNDG